MFSNRDLDPLLPERVDGWIDSSESLWDNTESLRSVLENIPVPEEVYQLLESTIGVLENVSALHRVVVEILIRVFIVTGASACESCHYRVGDSLQGNSPFNVSTFVLLR